MSLALVVGLKEVAPVVPGSLVAVLGGIIAVSVFDLDRHGVAGGARPERVSSSVQAAVDAVRDSGP